MLLATIPVFATTLISRLILKTTPLFFLVSVVLSEALFFLSIEIDRVVLSRRSKIATTRRMAASSIINNMLILVLAVLGLIVFSLTGSEIRYVSLVILGAFFAISFRAIIFGSVFYDRPWQGLPLAVVQPALVLAPAIGGFRLLEPRFITSSSILLAITAGLICIVAVEIYLWTIDRARSIASFRPFELLRAFLNAWASEDALALERFLEATSKEGTVVTRMLRIGREADSSDSEPRLVEIVIPGLHPGPFYPIGSSNLPGDVFSGLHSRGVLPLTVHSISDHGLNLPSRGQVERYIASFKNSVDIESGAKVSLPQTSRVNKATVNGLEFGSSVILTITQSPYGMEDFPTRVGLEITNYGLNKGCKNIFVIDTHNSEGAKPSDQECKDAIEASKQVIDVLRKTPQYDFKVGFAHSSEVKGWSAPDVGPGGLGLVHFEIGDAEHFSLVIADSNNSAIGFREKIMDQFLKSTSEPILEICTSDTHVTAAKTRGAKGYLALGDSVSVEKLSELLVELYKLAVSRLETGEFTSKVLVSNVKTIGSEVLNDFSGLLDASSSVAKDGASVLGTLAVVLTLIVALI